MVMPSSSLREHCSIFSLLSQNTRQKGLKKEGFILARSPGNQSIMAGETWQLVSVSLVKKQREMGAEAPFLLLPSQDVRPRDNDSCS